MAMDHDHNTTQAVTPSHVLTSFDVDIGESRPHFPSPMRDLDINWLKATASSSLPHCMDTQLVQAIPVIHPIQSVTASQSAMHNIQSKQLLCPAPTTLLPASRIARPSSAPPAESLLFGPIHLATPKRQVYQVQRRYVNQTSLIDFDCLPKHNSVTTFVVVNPHDMLSVDARRIRIIPSIPKVFGPTSFAIWASQWEQFTIYTWLRKLFHAPYPDTILTVCAHFVDANGAVPGVRVGSDLRVYHSTLTQRVAVLDWVSVSGKWAFFAVFVYGNSNGHAPEIEEKMGILVSPLELVETEENEAYEDEVALRERGIVVKWDYLGDENRHGVVLTFPEGHKHSVTKCVTDEVPADLIPQYRVKRGSSGADFEPARSH